QVGTSFSETCADCRNDLVKGWGILNRHFGDFYTGRDTRAFSALGLEFLAWPNDRIDNPSNTIKLMARRRPFFITIPFTRAGKMPFEYDTDISLTNSFGPNCSSVTHTTVILENQSPIHTADLPG